MTYLNTQQTLQFIQRNDRNGNGLSKTELMQGAMKSYVQMMHSMATGNQQGMMEAFQNLSTATQLAQGFDVMAQASGKFMPDNPMTISGLDVMKTAMNDGNMGNITNYDLASQNAQNQFGFGPQPGPFYGGFNPNMGMNNSVEIGGQMFPDLSSWNQQQPNLNYNQNFFGPQTYNMDASYISAGQEQGLSGKGAVGGLVAGLGLAALTGGAALPLVGAGMLLGSGLAGKALQGLGNFQQMIGQGMQGLGNMMEVPFQKVGDFLGKIPLVGGLLKGATNIAGKIFSAPMKIAGKITEIGGKLISGIGKVADKVGNFLKKL